MLNAVKLWARQIALPHLLNLPSFEQSERWFANARENIKGRLTPNDFGTIKVAVNTQLWNLNPLDLTSSPMPLEPEDTYRLGIWSFLKDFQNLRPKFIELARISYHSTRDLQGTKAGPDDCERLFCGILLSPPIFRGILARKAWLLPSFYGAYALAFARHVLHNHWQEISS
jgi:hypothetical protein